MPRSSAAVVGVVWQLEIRNEGTGPFPCTPSRDARCVLKDCSKDTLWSPWVPIICCSVAIVAGSEGPISNTTTATNAHAQSCPDTAASACRRLRPGRRTFFNSSVFSLSQHESSPTDSHVRHCVRSGRPPSAINAGVSVFETPVELSLVEGMAGRNRHVDLQVLQSRGHECQTPRPASRGRGAATPGKCTRRRPRS